MNQIATVLGLAYTRIVTFGQIFTFICINQANIETVFGQNILAKCVRTITSFVS